MFQRPDLPRRTSVAIPVFVFVKTSKNTILGISVIGPSWKRRAASVWNEDRPETVHDVFLAVHNQPRLAAKLGNKVLNRQIDRSPAKKMHCCAEKLHINSPGTSMASCRVVCLRR